MPYAEVNRFKSLAFKTVFPLIVVAAVISIGGTIYNLHMGATRLEDQLEHRAEHVANAVQYLLEIDPEHSNIVRIMNSLGGERNIQKILMIGGSPKRVIASSENTWIGMTLDELPDQTVQKNLRWGLTQPGVSFEWNENTGYYEYLQPVIYQEQGKLRMQRGLVFIALLPEGESSIGKETRLQLSLLVGAFLLLSGFAILLFRQNIHRPLRLILQAMEQRRQGDVDARSPITCNDELGILSAQYNHTLNSLSRAEERFSQLATHTNDVFWIFELAQNKILYTNPAFERVWGITRDRLYAEADVWISAIRDEDRQQVLDAWSHAVENRVSYEATYRIIAQNGQEKWIQDKGFSVRDKEGAIYRIVGIARDITDQKSMEREYIQARDAAEKLARTRSQFLANMSHEIRTPINGILGASELLLITELDEEQRDLSNLMNHSCRSLLAIINDILDLSKIEAGRMSIDSRGFAPRVVVDDVYRLLKGGAEQKGLAFHASGPDEGPRYLVGDAVRLRQVLINLVGNAIKFTNEGEVSVRASCRKLEGNHHRLMVEVEDTGIGIPAAKQESIFSSFSQADGSITRRFGGTGLGLAISRQLARMMDGDITLNSREGVGSVFSLKLTLEEAGEKQLKYIAGPRPKPPTFQGHVLLVEDQPINQKIAERMLRKMGLEITTTCNGQDALIVLKKQRFDLVLMDVQMPIMDGLQTTRALREFDSNTPVIAMTANVMNEDRDLCFEAGMNSFLGKPIKMDTLARELGRWLE